MTDQYDHVWRWKKWPLREWGGVSGVRFGYECRVLARGVGRGPRNIIVEFRDGEVVVAPRFSVRRVKPDEQRSLF